MVRYNAWCLKRCLPDGVTRPVPGTTQPKTKSDCCNKLKLTLHGDAAAVNVKYMKGTYHFAGTVNNHDYWTGPTIMTKDGSQVMALWYYFYNFNSPMGWRMHTNDSLGGGSASVFGPDTKCPRDQADGWRYGKVGSGKDIQWKCLGMFIFVLKFILLDKYYLINLSS